MLSHQPVQDGHQGSDATTLDRPGDRSRSLCLPPEKAAWERAAACPRESDESPVAKPDKANEAGLADRSDWSGVVKCSRISTTSIRTRGAC